MRVSVTSWAEFEPSAQAIVVPRFEDGGIEPLEEVVDRLAGGALAGVIQSGVFRGHLGETLLIPGRSDRGTVRVVLAGLGSSSELDGYRLRNGFQFAGRLTRPLYSEVSIAMDEELVARLSHYADLKGPSSVVSAIVEGVVLGRFDAGEFRHDKRAMELQAVQLIGLESSTALTEAITRAIALAEATNRTRVLQWRPSNRLTPTDFAAEAKSLAGAYGLAFDVLGAEEMRRLGMGALLAVAKGSHEPPALVVLRYDPSPRHSETRVLGLIGKGVTYDSGGISLKPSPGLVAMKADMSGAAAVLQAMGLIAQFGPRVKVLGICPMTENMPGGAATKPGDVVTAMNGMTVEVNNTDAEGRLILADALHFAGTLGATDLVDVATLTGAATVALGHTIGAAMSNSPELMSAVRAAACEVGERVWELPMYPEHDIGLTCDVADIRNTAEVSSAGAIHAGAFLRKFIGPRRWVHVDIDIAPDYPLLERIVPCGPTGAMTRTLGRLPFHLT